MDKMKVLETGGSLMKVFSIDECSPGLSALILILLSSFEWLFKTGLTVFTKNEI